MAVRVQKSAVNIREKLAELERPIGVNGAALMKTETPQEAFSLIGAGRKNMVINGDMRIDQRNGGSSISVSAASSPISVDRWRVNNGSGAVLTAQRIVDGPSGFAYCLSATITTADTDLTSNYLTIEQRLEGLNTIRLGWGTSQAKYATLSFYVKSSVTGKYGGSIRDADDGTSSYTFSYSINSANTWEYKTITIPPRTTDTWLTNTSGSIDVMFSLATGSHLEGVENTWNSSNKLTVPGCVNFAQTVNNNFRITGIQLEEGKVATPFEYRNIAEELSLCQRYFWKTDTDNVYSQVANGMYTTNNVVKCVVQHPVSMRTRPTVSVSSGQSNSFYAQQGDNALTSSGATFSSQWTAGSGVLKSWLDFNNVPGGTQGYAVAIYRANGNGALDFSAEL